MELRTDRSRIGRSVRRLITTRCARGVASVAAVLTLVMWPPAGLAGQDGVDGLAAACAGGMLELQTVCQEASLAALGLTLGAGVLQTGGSLIPLSPNTLGRRTPGGAPRIAISGRVGPAVVRIPDLASASADGRVTRESDGTRFGLQGALTLGVFEGFRLVPSVGGLLSLDVFGTVEGVPFPDREFAGTVWSGGLGARIGLLRESFTAPGIAVEMVAHRGGSLEYTPVNGDPAVVTRPSSNAVRVSIGKDIRGVTLVAGTGWDWYRPHVDLTLEGEAGTIANVRDRALEASRSVSYLGATLNFLVAQISAEVGWGGGVDQTDTRSAAYDPTEGIPFGALQARFIF
jgi:hypothetical protein